MTQPLRPELQPRLVPDEAAPVPHPHTLRVAVFSDSLPERNGAGAYYPDLAAHLEKELSAIELFQPALRRRFLRLALPLPGDATQKLITPNVPRLWRQYQRLRPHVVVAVTPGPFGLLGLLLARRSGAVFLTGFHTHFEELVQLYGKSVFYRICHAYLDRVNRFLLRRSRAVVVNNRNLAATVERLGAPRAEVMGTPLARSFLDAPLAPPPEGLQRLLFAGRLAPEKNLASVVEAARTFPQLEFIIAGDGPLRREMETAAGSLPNLRLRGWLDRAALCSEMDRANLLLLPSHLETFGTVALEALARGRPALVSANAGIHDWRVLRPAIFRIEEGETLSASLRRLLALDAATWSAKVAAARAAALALNDDTVRQWAAMISRHAAQTR